MRSSIVFSGGSSRIGVASRGRTARRSVPTSEPHPATARLISINSASPRLIFNKYLIETPHSGMGPPGHVFFRKGVVVGSSGASNRPKPRPRRIAQQNPLRLPGSPNGLCPVNPGCRTRLSADRDTTPIQVSTRLGRGVFRARPRFSLGREGLLPITVGASFADPSVRVRWASTGQPVNRRVRNL